MPQANRYEVIVGNIGTVYDGPRLTEARKAFAEYVSQSKTNYGRAGGEDVNVLKNGELLKTFWGERGNGPDTEIV